MKKWFALIAALLPAVALAGTEWAVLESGKDITIYKRQLADDKEPEIKAVGGFPAAPKDVFALITDIPRYSKLLSHLEKAEVLKSTASEAVVYFKFDFPWPIADRDYVAAYKWEQKGDSFVIKWQDANYWRPDVPKGVVRIEKVRGSWTLDLKSDGTTAATYIFLADYGGELPEWAKKDAHKGEPTELFKVLKKGLGY
jgi:hypothetical protein